jgi:hypothetical protein
MLDPDTLPWRDSLVLTREIPIAGERTEFYERVRRGEFVSLRRGVYMATEKWLELNDDERYRARVQATVAFATRPVCLSHVSAASIWRLPWIGPYPRAIHVMGQVTTGGRSTSVVSHHADGRPVSTEVIDGIEVTSLARTVVDIARSSDFALGVAVADAALRRTDFPLDGLPRTFLSRDELLHEVALLPIPLGSARARRAVEFADARADRPGESISRVNMALARLTLPQLQVGLRGASGRLWHVDFWWPDFDLIGEFDGKAKYTEEKYLRGRTPQQVVYEEKLREDDLRAVHRGFTRWSWDVAMSMPRLRAQLISAGLR